MSEDFKIPTIDEVLESMDSLFKIIDYLDENYKMYDNNFLLRHFKNRGVSLRDIFTSDMLDWLCFLGWGDNKIHVNEVDFINRILNSDLTQTDVMDVVKKLDAKSLSQIPLTFAIFIEYEEICDVELDGSIVEALFSLFFITGSYLIVSDGNVDEGEVQALMAYVDTLRINIDTFNLDSIHDYMLDQI